MIKQIKYLIDNLYINIAGISAMVLSPFADAIGSPAYWWLFGGLLLLFVFGIFDELVKNNKLSTEIIHIPIVIKVDDGPESKYVMQNLIERIEQKNGLNNYEALLQKYFSLNLEDFIFEYNGSIYEFDRLISFARIIKYSVAKIEKQFKGRVKFHVAYYRRPSIGFLIGTIFRTEGVVVYQNSDFDNKFYDVADIKNRDYKSQVKEFTKYIIENIKSDNSKEIVLIAIESSSHSIAIESSNLKNFDNIIRIKSIEGSTIPYEIDWTSYAQQIYTVLNQAQTKYKKIVIAHAMPEALSIVLGMALENYWNIDITQFDQNDYKYIYTMNQIKYFN
ncbi:SAVED domain-containing protein [Aliarcobacter skirrowii]|uniref:SAVED domain-containing protein n=1 Tax=Aliarcobacter skirrowii TaxID=28200 RepID=UPI00320BB402